MHKTKIIEEKARVYQHKKNNKNKHMDNNKNKPNTKGGEIGTDKLKIIYLNIRSIKNKMQELLTVNIKRNERKATYYYCR